MSALQEAQARLEALRRAHGEVSRPSVGGGWLAALKQGIENPLPDLPGGNSELPGDSELPEKSGAHVRHYPSLGIGMLRGGSAAVGRIWLVCRHLDTDGRGWLSLDVVREQLTGKQSPLYLFGKRRLRTLLREGEGIYWRRETTRLWLYGAAKVAQALEVMKLEGQPVQLPLAHLLGGMQEVKAALFAACHQSEMPRSQAFLEEKTGVSERSQRRYNEVVGVVYRPSLFIGRPYEEDAHRDVLWNHASAFVFVDRRGMWGKAGKQYSAYRLPNRYQACFKTAAMGRQKKIQKHLTDLVINGVVVNDRAQGNGQVQRVFFADGKAAVDAWRGRATVAYFEETRVRGRTIIWGGWEE